jgi:CheY-like chemotaxis protein
LVRLGITILPDVWPIEVDISELDLALVNLTANARDAMPHGGMVTLTAENVCLQPDDTPLRLEGEFVAVTVADTGPGIPEDILPKVFDPFFTTKPAGKGTGLGLSQVHGFAHQSHGTVTIASQIGAGTRVTMYLPRARSRPTQVAAGPEAVEHMLGGTALLVEDNPDVAQATTTMLEELGYKVSTVTGADAALQALDAGSFDLVLSNVVMGGSMNGIELARILKTRNPTLPVVLATGYSNAVLEAGDDFVVLRKPYQLAELNRTIANLVARTRLSEGQGNLVDFREAKRERAAKDTHSSDE